MEKTSHSIWMFSFCMIPKNTIITRPIRASETRRPRGLRSRGGARWRPMAPPPVLYGRAGLFVPPRHEVDQGGGNHAHGPPRPVSDERCYPWSTALSDVSAGAPRLWALAACASRGTAGAGPKRSASEWGRQRLWNRPEVSVSSAA